MPRTAAFLSLKSTHSPLKKQRQSGHMYLNRSRWSLSVGCSSIFSTSLCLCFDFSMILPASRPECLISRNSLLSALASGLFSNGPDSDYRLEPAWGEFRSTGWEIREPATGRAGFRFFPKHPHVFFLFILNLKSNIDNLGQSNPTHSTNDLNSQFFYNFGTIL